MNCNHCGTELNEGATVCTVCGTPVQTAAVNPAELPKKENVGLGFVGALVGALLGGASIILLSRLGYVAAISGIILAFCTLKGYELLGKRMSKVGFAICCVLMLVTPLAANALDLLLQIYEMLKEYGVTMADTVTYVVELITTDPEMLKAYLSDLGMVYLFTVIGAFIVVRNALRNL